MADGLEDLSLFSRSNQRLSCRLVWGKESPWAALPGPRVRGGRWVWFFIPVHHTFGGSVNLLPPSPRWMVTTPRVGGNRTACGKSPRAPGRVNPFPCDSGFGSEVTSNQTMPLWCPWLSGQDKTRQSSSKPYVIRAKEVGIFFLGGLGRWPEGWDTGAGALKDVWEFKKKKTTQHRA